MSFTRLLLAVLVATGAQAAAAQPLLPNPDAKPQAVLSETILDFGVLARGETASRTFTLENRGEAPLEIRHVKNNCSCTLLDVPPEIPPLQKVELTMRLDTETLTGPAQTVVNLFTNDPTAPRLDVTVKVESRAYVWAEPAEFRYMVYRFFEGSGMVSAKVAGATPSDFKILAIDSPSPFITLSHREARQEERLPGGPGTQYVIEAKLDPKAPVGPISGWVRVTTDHAKQKKLSIPVSGFVRPLLHLTPPEADFGTVTLGTEPLRWSHHFKNFATEKVEIVRTETNIPGLTVELVPGDNDHELYVALVLAPDAPKGPIRGKVTLYTTSSQVPELELPVRGTVQ
jgi:Protein of unknown function (DUF1573)